jgi:drug/metabolite transporter (DMT)-like permease
MTYWQSSVRRELDRRPDGLRPYMATALAICGGLAALYLFFAAIGAIDPASAVPLTVAAIVLAALWAIGFAHRFRHQPAVSQLRDRERRGF